MFWIPSLCSYDPPKIFYTPLKSPHSIKNQLFYRISPQKSHHQTVPNLKNDHSLTFIALKSDWDVARCSRLISSIAMIVNMLSTCIYECWRLAQKFSTSSKSEHHIHKNTTFLDVNTMTTRNCFWGSMDLGKWPSGHVWMFKIWLTHHTMLPFLFPDNYDHEDVSKTT